MNDPGEQTSSTAGSVAEAVHGAAGRMSARTLSIVVVLAALLLVVVLAPHIFFIVFAGVLLGTGLRGGGDFLARHLHLPALAGLALFVIILAGLLATFFAVAAPSLAAQLDELARQLPEAIAAIRAEIENVEWMRRGLQQTDASEFIGSLGASGGRAVAFLGTLFGGLTTVVLILFLGIFLAISPHLYRRGFLSLLAPSLRPTGARMLDEATVALRGWMLAQAGSMTAVGVLMWLGLMALGVPLAGILGFLSGLLAFIPNLGPILAATPTVLLALTEGTHLVYWVIGLVLVVQTVESYMLTPYLQLETVSLPPALTISVQVLFGVLFGTIGLALATPLLAVTLRLTHIFYVDRYLEDNGPRCDPDGRTVTPP